MLLLWFLACGEKETGSDTAVDFNAAEALVEQLTGTFDSSAQSIENTAYYSVSLKTCVVDFPELGEYVLYVEQALSDKLQQPYRQRFYVIESIESADVASHIYELDNPNAFIGLCDGGVTPTFSLDAINQKEGCSVYLDWTGEGFEGATDVGTCKSTMNGAAYATSEVKTTETSILSWDRGWNANDEQVWGAVDGAYIFIRQ